VNSATGQPVRAVELSLAASGRGEALATTTDAEGKFRFDRVKPGRYSLRGSKAGYERGNYGATDFGGRGRTLAVTNQDITGLEFRLIPLGIIQGKVLNRNGDPVPGVTIACGFEDMYGAPPTMEPLKNATDERGEFRLPDMPPGRYYVQALPPPPARPGDEGANLPAYYPAAANFSEAQAIPLRAGQEASGIKITLREAPVYRVRGKVTGAVWRGAYSDLDLFLVPRADAGGPMLGKTYSRAISQRVGGSHAVQPDGSFELHGVERGEYELVSSFQAPVARVAVSVTNRDVEGVIVPLGDIVQLSVRFQAERETTGLSCAVLVYPLDNDPALADMAGQTRIDSLLTFRAMPGKYAPMVRCQPGNWALKSARLEAGVGAQDVLDAGVDLSGISGSATLTVVVGQGVGTVVATVKDGDKPAPGKWLTLIPDPSRPGRAGLEASGWSDDAGRVVMAGVAPGDYRVYAWRQASVSESSVHPEFLKRFEAQSAKVTVRAGEQAQVETRIIQP
jgi:hypothetical protein